MTNTKDSQRTLESHIQNWDAKDRVEAMRVCIELSPTKKPSTEYMDSVFHNSTLDYETIMEAYEVWLRELANTDE